MRHDSGSLSVREATYCLVLLIGSVYLIGRIPDIQRVFGYHGAEHKAINAMEHGDPLDVPHVRRASRVVCVAEERVRRAEVLVVLALRLAALRLRVAAAFWPAAWR